MRNVAPALCLSGLLVSLSACASSSDRNDPVAAAPLTENETETQPAELQEETPAPVPQEFLDREQDRLTLEEQKRRFLIKQELDTARELRNAMRLEQAEQAVSRVLEMDADNIEAKDLLREINMLLGRGQANQNVQDMLQENTEIRIQQIREEAKENLRKAKVLLARGDYDGAIVELQLTLDRVEWEPYGIDWEGVDQEAKDLLASAKAQRDQAAAAQREEAQRAARGKLLEQEAQERDRRTALVTNLMNQAITAFEAGDYEEAIEYADRVLRENPRHERARNIRNTAFRAGREKVQADFLEKKLEQYARWQEEMDELRIPYVDIVNLPDEDYWRHITEIRSRRLGLAEAAVAAPGEAALRESLKTTRLPGLQISEEESLTSVIDALKAITGVPLIVDPAAEEAAIDEGVVFDFDLQNPLRVEEALNLITDMAGAEVTWTIRHDAVLVTTREKARGELMIYNHDVQDLIFGLTDFLGPRIDRLRLVDDLEDDDGGGPFGGIGERPQLNEPDELAQLVQDNVAVGTWDGEGIAITAEGGNMIVVHTPEVQRQVFQFLDDLRRFSSSLVTIESKFMNIEKNFLQEIGVDLRGLDNPGVPFTDLDDLTNGLEDNTSLGLDNSGTGLAAGPPSSGVFFDDGGDGDYKGRSELFFGKALGDALTNIGGLTAQYTFLNDIQISAILSLVEKNENVELINDQILSVHNTQRAFVTVVNQRAYVQDFDVEVAQFQAIADPVINVLTEGIVLDVRPTIHHNRKYLTLEIQPTVANVVALTDFTTTLAGQTSPLTFQLPELEVASVFTTAIVPDGGSILVGGLSRLRNIERRAEVPWLANIPLLGFFFKEEGYNDERSSLMIMIRAWITDVRRELAALEGR